MVINQVSRVIHHLRKAAHAQDGMERTDGQLLERFVSHREEAALEALVRRHGPMVWGVCRRLLHHQDAEDAFQATFLILVRKATSVVPREMVGNWLYGVAHQTALNARTRIAKRRAREVQVPEMPEPAVIEHDLWRGLQPILDQELSRLPDKYRVVIVLCDLEGKSRKEAARQLDLPEGTVASRLARARSMLAKRLARHGLAVSSGILAAMLPQEAASAGVPPAVMSTTIKAVTLVAAGQAASSVLSAPVATLTEGVLKAMLLTKLKTVLTVVLVLGMVAFGGGLLTHLTATGQEANQKAEQADAPLFSVAFADSGTVKPPGKDPTEDDKERIKGTWLLMSMEVAGTPAPFVGKPEEDVDRLAVFTGEKVTTHIFKGKGFTFELDPSKKPKAIDLHPLEDAKQTDFGIYELDGDDLKICITVAPDELVVKRPAAFATRAGQANMLLVFKRQKSAQAKPVKTLDYDAPDRVDAATDSRQFQIPVLAELAQRKGITELQLFVSADEGETWRRAASLPPDGKAFSFTAPSEGLYWFHMRVVKSNGTVEPSNMPSRPMLKGQVGAREPKGRKDREKAVQELKAEVKVLRQQLEQLEKQLSEIEKSK